jgi:curved DNA-binding protein CbpA
VTHYDVLGVAPTADEAQLREAYVALARRHHPDVEGGDAERMRAINDAWATLGDRGRRAVYDRQVAHIAPPPAPGRAPVGFDEPGGAFWDLDDDDLVSDDVPLRATVALPRWVSLIPTGLFLMSIGVFVVGVVMVSQPLLGLALMTLLLSCLFFLASPFIALFASRRGGAR